MRLAGQVVDSETLPVESEFSSAEPDRDFTSRTYAPSTSHTVVVPNSENGSAMLLTVCTAVKKIDPFKE